MPRTRSGSIYQREDKSWWARITYIEAGKRKEKWRRANNRTHARELVKLLLRELDDYGDPTLDAARMTFAQLSDYYEKKYLTNPQYVDDRKVGGLRSLKSVVTRWRVIRDYFGKKKLRSITYGDIETFRYDRLNTPTVHGKPRSITSVNRELEILRSMFNIALREGWIIRNPFMKGTALLNKSDERRRERILTRNEEERLLGACSGRREHIRSIVITALDTGMRRGEILTLKWSDINFEYGIITVRAFNTKTLRERQVAMTERLMRTLRGLDNKSTKDPDALVFGILDNVRKAFNSARKIAGLPDVRFHDLRHTYATRLASAHIPLSEVGRALGHTQANTTYRYVNTNVEYNTPGN